MSNPIYQVIAQSCKTSQLFGQLCSNLLERYRQALDDFMKQALSEISWMRIQGVAVAVTGVLTGVVGMGLALMPKGAGNSPSTPNTNGTTNPLSNINGEAMKNFGENMKQFFAKNQEMIKGGMKTAQKALPLLGNAGQSFTQSAVVKSQTEKNLTQTTRLTASMDLQKEIHAANQNQQDHVNRILQAAARARSA